MSPIPCGYRFPWGRRCVRVAGHSGRHRMLRDRIPDRERGTVRALLVTLIFPIGIGCVEPPGPIGTWQRCEVARQCESFPARVEVVRVCADEPEEVAAELTDDCPAGCRCSSECVQEPSPCVE